MIDMAKKILPELILASESPRRRELLARAGYRFKVVPSNIDEAAFSIGGLSPCQYAEKLALAKAGKIAGDFPDAVVIGADTIVDSNGKIVGKAADAKEAEAIIRMLFARPHYVITGLAILWINKNIRIVESVSTTVYPKKLSEEQIAQYIKSNLWKGKAGAYGIQETAEEFVERIDGSLTNVMGFPMERLMEILNSLIE